MRAIHPLRFCEPLIEPSAEQRHAMIAEAAYFIAAQRGFLPGYAVHDWLAAEAQINLKLACSPTAQSYDHSSGARLVAQTPAGNNDSPTRELK